MQKCPLPAPQKPYVCRATPLSALSTLIGGMIQFPIKNQRGVAYIALACTEEDRLCIYEIISTLAKTNAALLLFKEERLNEVGEQIRHLHPLKFLSSVLTHPYLKGCLREIFDDFFKRRGFLSGFTPNLLREVEKGTMDCYQVEFAQEVQIPLESFASFLQSRDWEGMIQALLSN
jgi:hypothetical protein